MQREIDDHDLLRVETIVFHQFVCFKRHSSDQNKMQLAIKYDWYIEY